MNETLTMPRVLPIGTILFELLFLLVAIPIEAYVMHTWLKFDKKTSMFYAIAINVFSSVIGWNIFFLLEPMLPIQIKSELISYVFFGNFNPKGAESFVILTSFIIFITTFLMKFGLLKSLLIVLDNSEKKPEETSTEFRNQRWQINRKAKLKISNLATTMLIANSLSYTAITAILLIRGK
jgi:hypothetical protein